jgi:hypothetical protein
VTTSASEDRRPASTLDERIARDCERSGVPFHVEDDALLERVAELTELAWAGDDDAATRWHQGREAVPSGSASDASSSASPNSKGPGLTNRDLRNITPRTTEKVVAS